MHCPVVSEELKLRAFGGDFDKLLAWSRAEEDGAALRLGAAQQR